MRMEVDKHDRELQDLDAKFETLDEITSPKYVVTYKYKK